MERTIKPNKITDYLESKSQDRWYFKPCPFCGSTDIGVKDTILDLLTGQGPCVARRKIWAYCRYCGAASGHTVADVIGDDEEIAAAIEKWNKRKED